MDDWVHTNGTRYPLFRRDGSEPPPEAFPLEEFTLDGSAAYDPDGFIASYRVLATVPFVPVPSLLYRKFAGMRRLGVTHTMLCWYFGNYPGLMNQAAGLLSCEPQAVCAVIFCSIEANCQIKANFPVLPARPAPAGLERAGRRGRATTAWA